VLISNCREIVAWKRLAYFLCFKDVFSRYDLQDATAAFGVNPWFFVLQLACEAQEKYQEENPEMHRLRP
jgi:hypothetical protein